MRMGKLILNIALASSMLVFTTCKKVNTVYQPALIDSSRISITNASPTISDLQFYLNNQPVSLPNAPLSYGQTVYAFYINDANPYRPDTTLLPYINIATGYQQLGFGTHSNSDIYSNSNDEFEPGNSYSVFVTDTLKHGQLTTVFLHDYIGKMDSTHGQIRFINLSPDAPPLDLWAYLDAGPNGVKISGNCGYIPNDFNSLVNAQTFSFIESGPYFFIATEAGTSNIVLQGQLYIPPQNVVTIYTKGYIGGVGNNAIDVGVIQYQP
jgi:Domain of unknown function (DUF4397)